jgi:CHASE1-domain containing sensor protein
MVSHLTKETKVWAPLALIVVVGVALSICASVVSAGFNAAQTRAEFERQASGEIAALKVSIAASLNAVNSLSALYQARGTAARDEFQRFAETILASDPSIQALEWARVVVHDQRADVERGLAEESGRAIHFTERNGRGELVTPASVHAMFR